MPFSAFKRSSCPHLPRSILLDDSSCSKAICPKWTPRIWIQDARPVFHQASSAVNSTMWQWLSIYTVDVEYTGLLEISYGLIWLVGEMNTAPTLLCGRGALYLFTFKLRTQKCRRRQAWCWLMVISISSSSSSSRHSVGRRYNQLRDEWMMTDAAHIYDSAATAADTAFNHW